VVLQRSWNIVADNIVAGVAMEDAASLTALLPAETQPEDLPERLALYQKLRDERAHKIQEVSRLMGRDLDDESRGKLNSKK
jgi:2-polyprenyl-6-methoxyphenol hydroxylase-like FAD-dependent oxidoreductase